MKKLFGILALLCSVSTFGQKTISSERIEAKSKLTLNNYTIQSFTADDLSELTEDNAVPTNYTVRSFLYRKLDSLVATLIGASTPTFEQVLGADGSLSNWTQSYVVNMGTEGLQMNSTGVNSLTVNNTSSTVGASAISGNGGNGPGVFASGSASVAMFATRWSSSNSTVVPIMQFYRNSPFVAANGMGAEVIFSSDANGGVGPYEANSIRYKWLDASNGSRTSEFAITGYGSGTKRDLFVLNGSGQAKLPAYAAGTFTGTASKWLARDAIGNIIDVDAPSGGGSDTSALKKSLNLSDLTNTATARTNLGLGNVNNTSDASKPVSTLQQAEINKLKDSIAMLHVRIDSLRNAFLPKDSLDTDGSITKTQSGNVYTLGVNPEMYYDRTSVDAGFVEKTYIEYSATITMNALDEDPTVVVHQNDLGGTVTWAWDEAGVYTATSSALFTSGKTTISITGSYEFYTLTREIFSTSVIKLKSNDPTNFAIPANYDGSVDIVIRVYN